MSSRTRHSRIPLLLVAACLLLVACSSTATSDVRTLDPVEFGLPAGAKEIIELRSEHAATFEVSPGKFAAVSGGAAIFVQDANGKWVIPEERK